MSSKETIISLSVKPVDEFDPCNFTVGELPTHDEEPYGDSEVKEIKFFQGSSQLAKFAPVIPIYVVYYEDPSIRDIIPASACVKVKLSKQEEPKVTEPDPDMFDDPAPVGVVVPLMEEDI